MTRLSALAAFGLVFGSAAPAAADEVMGYELEPVRYRYVVTSAVNVREKPLTNSKRIETLDDGAVPDVLGRYKGWYAIARDGKPHGFVYGSVMLPTLSGALDAPLVGRTVPGAGLACDYVVSHISSEPIPGELFGTSDYDVRLSCERSGLAVRAHLPMFLVEGPLGGRDNPVFQISLDVPEIAGGYDRVLSTILLYRAEDDVVRFDALSIDGYGGVPNARERPAADIREALVTALGLALASWGDKVWEVLAKRTE